MDLKGNRFSSKYKLFLFLGLVSVILSSILVLTLTYNGNVNHFISPTFLSAFNSLIITVSSGFLGGQLALKVSYPPMLGMLLAGMIVRNAFPFLIVDIPHSWTSILWTFSLASVVARAGLALDLDILRKNAKAVLLLGTIPILVEASWLAYFSHRIFYMPQAWSNLLAFGVASISPGVVVPLILTLNDNSAWSGSRLPPVMIASVSIDVLVATVGFGISLKHAFQNSENQDQSSFLLAALKELALGVFLGIAFGLVAFSLKFLKTHTLIPFSLMFLLSAFTMGWDETHTATGIASCSIIISWATAANTWSKEDISVSDSRLKTLWDFFKLFLFPVIGASVSFSTLPVDIFLKCLALVLSSVAVKYLLAFIASYVSGLEYDECVFISGIWTGKASVQAALCGAALEIVHAKNLFGTREEHYANLVFMSMLSAIVIGCPIAGVWFSFFSKRPVGLIIEEHDET